MGISTPQKGRGALSNPEGRFESVNKERAEDGWERPLNPDEEEELPFLETILRPDPSRSIISRNDSPDIPFSQSINPYKGCEHGCIYCYARPTHEYLNLSPGLDFETKIFYKDRGPELLEQELRRPSYRPQAITLGANTDPYQPAERELKITRGLLEVLNRFNHPLSIITKSTLVARDVDILSELAAKNLVAVMVTITTLNNDLKRTLEPRAPAGSQRLKAIETLAKAGVPVGVMTAPIIPVVNDAEMETILEKAHDAGAQGAGYVLLRLPYQLKDLFREWLATHYPLKAEHVMSIINQSRGGKDYDSAFGTRMRGTGRFADLIAQRFALATKRLDMQFNRRFRLETAHFKPPPEGGQMELL